MSCLQILPNTRADMQRSVAGVARVQRAVEGRSALRAGADPLAAIIDHKCQTLAGMLQPFAHIKTPLDHSCKCIEH